MKAGWDNRGWAKKAFWITSNYTSVNVIMITLLLFCLNHIISKYLGVKDLDFGLVWLVVFSFCFYLVQTSEKAMAPHSSTLAWKIPWTEEPGRLQSMGSLRVGHDWTISLSLFCIGEGNGNPLQCSCLENPRDGGAWWAAVCRVAQSRTRLKWLSSSGTNLVFVIVAYFITI